VYSDLPPFPKKKIIGNLNPSHIAKRRIKLELYLQGISKLQGVADFLAFQTFLTGDSRDSVNAKKQKKSDLNTPSSNPNSNSDSQGGSSGSGKTTKPNNGGTLPTYFNPHLHITQNKTKQNSLLIFVVVVEAVMMTMKLWMKNPKSANVVRTTYA
jgi:hypothetical protein